MDSKLREEHRPLEPVKIPYNVDAFWLMLKGQRDLRSIYAERFPEHVAEPLSARLVALTDALAMEVAELKEWLPWKYWKAGFRGELSEVEVAGAVEELTDILHFVLEAFLELGIDRPEQIAGYYLAKNAVNRQRQEEGY